MAQTKTSGIYFKVTDEERNLIKRRMELAGIRNMSAYIRKMCIDGYTVLGSLSSSEIDELQSLTDSCCEMMQNFVRQVKKGKWRQHD